MNGTLAAPVLAFLLGSSVLPLSYDQAEAAEGVVFVDDNGNGERDPGEAGRAGVAVSNGREVTRTEASGRFTLPAGGEFIFITRPSGFASTHWYRKSGGDFALTRLQAHEEFFFVQISDAHVYDRREDYPKFSRPKIPWFVPDFLTDWLSLRFLERMYPTSRKNIAAAFRGALEPYCDGIDHGVKDGIRDGGCDRADLAGLSASAVLRAYNEEFLRPGSELGNVAAAARAAIAEVASLGPAFILNTGDLVLEGNNGSADAVERWFRFYVSLVAPLAMPVYNTIGNNEIAGTQNKDFPSDDPRFGKRVFEQHFGPTHFSFDYGDFHFVVLDTHRRKPESSDAKDWSFRHMEPSISAWADADLRAHRGKVLVALNHEPFHFDPAWPFANTQGNSQDDGLFAKHRVRYALSGHTHWKSFMTIDGVHHLTAGALSGLRWVMPIALHERGYRLFYARDRILYSAWKQTGQPVITAAEPPSSDPRTLVLVAADVAGPFERIEVKSGGRVLETVRWGDYFTAVKLPESIDSEGAIEIDASAVRSDGSRFDRVLSAP